MFWTRSDQGEGLFCLVSQATNRKAMDEEKAKQSDLEEVNNVGAYSPEYATSFYSECLVLSDRNLKNTIRTPELFLSRAAMMVSVLLSTQKVSCRFSFETSG